MQKEEIITRLKENGFRITKQRELLIDIILNGDYSCCKEVYYLAHKKDPGIGTATVYRTVDALEKIGALERKMAFRLCREEKQCRKWMVELEDGSVVELDYKAFQKVMEKGMECCDYSKGKRVKNIMII
ncbi:MAG: Fur family transcriptional regulator [Lachnospiraceae bacterium]